MMRLKWLAVACLTMVLFVAGCGKEEYPPVPINEEVDRCEICNMAIKDDAHATQIITKEGQSLKFDDLGDLNVWRTEHGTENIAATYVRDYNSLEWIKYEKANYVYDASIQTPMAFGIISFEKVEDAEQYVTDNGVGIVMNADDLGNHSWAVNKEMRGSHGHEHSHDGEAGHDEAGHDEAGHDEAGHDEAGHDEAGHDEAEHMSHDGEAHTEDMSHESETGHGEASAHHDGA